MIWSIIVIMQIRMNMISMSKLKPIVSVLRPEIEAVAAAGTSKDGGGTAGGGSAGRSASRQASGR